MLKQTTALGWWDVADELFSHIKVEADRYFAQEKQDKEEAFSDPAKFKKRQARMRQLFLEMLGGLPEERTPLQVQETGAVQREKYTIQKLIFQSLPGCYVTANLYLPLGVLGKRPAVLFCCGHAEEAKAYPPYQRVMIDLVRQGFVVLGFDPVGQGERKSYFNPQTGQELIQWGTTEHDYDGNRCYLIGTNIARYFVWDGIRAIDYLVSRPEVDPERIGVTGNSGGGTQTCYLMVADERIRAAVPCTFVTSRQIFLRSGNPHDAEQNLLGAIQHGFNYDDFLLCFAPKPALIGAVTYDFFPIEGTLQTFERARRAYKLCRTEDKVELAVATGEHEYAKELREACVRWFYLHLMGKEVKFHEPEFEVESAETLWCLPQGQVRADLPDYKGAYEQNRDYARRLPLPDFDLGDLQAVQAQLKRLLGWKEERIPIRPRIRWIDEGNIQERKVLTQHLFFFSEKGVAVGGMRYTPEGHKGTVLLLLEEGTTEIDKEKALILGYLRQRWAVFVLDVRDVGDSKQRQINAESENDLRRGAEFLLAHNAIMLGRPLPGMRVWDVVRGYEFLRQQNPKPIRLHAKGPYASLYALFAAVIEEAFEEVRLEGLPGALRHIVEDRFYQWHVKGVVPGLLKYFDLPDLVRLLGLKVRLDGEKE
jgi:cephalosporin-C deacetylase-like acetyl esterase